VPEPLPPSPAPQGAYRPVVVAGSLAVTAGMTPRVDGELVVRGIVGRELDVNVATEAAHLAGRNAVAALITEAGGPEAVQRCLRMTVFVACVDGFTELSAVADGASRAIREHLPEAGLPVRSAVGVQALPGGAPVEVELMAALR
jgi:enamine deaminase RidA (YjgF/YER057c/UK114 family)